eukprot:c4874_g1_i1.p1 GENE.c4874_g1_i1~~c4874_g1_i1.p1  ORF type:complete len:314 (+),score=70.64 c4874_g1_i1:19-960(+)
MSTHQELVALYSRVVRNQTRDENQTGLLTIEERMHVPARHEEITDWMRSLLINPNDSERYVQELSTRGFDTLESLTLLPLDVIKEIVTKQGSICSIVFSHFHANISFVERSAHVDAISRNLPILSNLTTLVREEYSWQWDDQFWKIPQPEASASEEEDSDDSETEDQIAKLREQSWVPYSNTVSRRIETARLTGQRDLVIVMGHNQKYRVDLVSLHQTNIRTGRTRDIRRVPPVSCRIPIPNSMLCPIGLSVMRDPVVAADGHSYERENIEKWFSNHSSSPKTMLPLAHKSLLPNQSLKEAIEKFLSISTQLS